MHGALPRPFLIVGVGASAGGVEALTGLFGAVPAEPGMAFVVVSHIGPGRESMLDQIIARSARLPVSNARNDDPIEPNHIYVLSTNATISVKNNRLVVLPRSAPSDHNPIDVFFTALGEDCGEYSAGVVLSGSGSDGTLGIKAIKEHGGLTLAQGTSGHTHPGQSGMPESAVASGLVDRVLAVEEIPSELARYAESLATVPTPGPANEAAPESAEIRQARSDILVTLRERFGHDFSGHKDKPFMRRVVRRMRLLRVANLQAYADLLKRDPEEPAKLLRDLLIGVTDFFRDAEAFATLQKAVVPELFAVRDSNSIVRVWVPGCATGEEAYSIAILLSEYIDKLPYSPRVQIFATDIARPALSVARAGRYPAAQLAGRVSQDRIERFFVSSGDTLTISKPLREMCVFSDHSLLRDPPFSRIDLISCRNLLIYLDAEAQRRIIAVFDYALRPGGYLFLGPSESISQLGDSFAYLDKKQRIFRRRDRPGVRLRPTIASNMPYLPRDFDALRQPMTATQLQHAVQARVLDRFAPAHVVVNRDGDIVYQSANTARYLEATAGAPTRHLLSLARADLRVELRRTLQQAVQNRARVVRDRMSVLNGDVREQFRLIVEPFGHSADDPLFLVVFAEAENGSPRPSNGAGRVDALPAGAPHEESPDKDEIIGQIERELADTHERWLATITEYEGAIEELKSGNEELNSMNEELQSTNEELDTSKEELQSLNEELQTVNTELQAKIDELDTANSDLANLFESTQMATVFLDHDLVIRSFTPAACSIFKLIQSDKNRSLTDIVSQIDYPELGQDVAETVTTGMVHERRVSQRDGSAHYIARILPYLTADKASDGVVVTFVDITQLTHAERDEERTRVLIGELNHRVRNMLAVVISVAQQTLMPDKSLKDAKATLIARYSALARSYTLVARQNWGFIALQDLVEESLGAHMLGQIGRVKIDGWPVHVSPRAALSLGMALHELATNAVKYGAFSNDMGTVSVSWDANQPDTQDHLTIRWVERGGPAVVPPNRRGFGSDLLEKNLSHDLDARIDLRFEPAGVECDIVIPLSNNVRLE
ncbi:CheR family methyltransferase [Blastochloris viridis]|uniref:Blue-light-activated histidine kinase n=1 Tax=Blastochloris viridis TaxID=1079 RepID=A0A0H5BEN7_BLAVI|nr:CheR family methyltransferase [Blastochloris viridis]ALK09441.1 Blue-light-activated histidine kinase [Blastochloris viridis]BAS00678.1 chemotaxis protein methyltransferase CheR [Blastochloris viridis]CUU42104.1 Blue-light-activated histidine kinase [Blastochloris viridis]